MLTRESPELVLAIEAIGALGSVLEQHVRGTVQSLPGQHTPAHSSGVLGLHVWHAIGCVTYVAASGSTSVNVLKCPGTQQVVSMQSCSGGEVSARGFSKHH